MINKTFSRLLGLVAFAGFFASCDEEQTIVAQPNLNKPTMTIDTPATINATEGDVIPFTLTLSKPVGQAFDFFVVYQIQGSSADEGDSSINADLGNTTFQKRFVVPPFVTTFSGEIQISADLNPEESEVLVLSIGDTRTTAVIFTPVITKINITNIGGDMTLIVDWDKEFNLFGADYTLCNLGYDVDVLVFDAAGDLFGGGAQTGDCPEELAISVADYPNGTYDIAAYLYDEADVSTAGISPALDFPVTITYQRPGSWTLDQEQTFVQTAGFTSDDPDDTLIYLLTLEVNNGVFTLKNDATTIAQGKQAFKAKKLNLARKK